MKMFILLLVIQYLSLFQIITLADKSFEIQFIVDYVKKQVPKPYVSAYVCWKNDYLQKLSEILNKNGNTANIGRVSTRNMYFPKFMNHLQIVDLTCNNTTEFLKSVNKGFNFRVPNHWLILDGQLNQTPKIDNAENNIFDELNIFIDTKVVLVQKQNLSFVLQYVYKMRSKSQLIYDEFAIWEFKRGFMKFEAGYLSQRRQNINHFPIRVSIFILDKSSLDHMDDYRYNEIDTWSKLNYVLTNHLMYYMNATRMDLIFPYYYNYSGGNHNGTALGSVIYRQIDITGSIFLCTSERISWLDCIALTTPGETYFYFRQPPLSYVKNIYVLPFGTTLWIIYLSFLILSSVLLYIVVIWEWKIIRETGKAAESDMIHMNFSDAILFTMGAVCQQGYATEPKGAPGKILILTVFVTILFLFTAYAAYTVVLFQETGDDIKTLEDLYKSDMKLGVENKPYYRHLVAIQSEPLHKKIFLEKIHPEGGTGNYYPLEEGIAKMRKEYFAFFTDEIAGNKMVSDTFFENEKCGLEQMSYLINVKNLWIVSPKNIPFKEIFTMGYRKIFEAGLTKRELGRRLEKKPKCIGNQNSYRSAGLIDLYPIYMILIIGIAGSMILLITEVITYKTVHHTVPGISTQFGCVPVICNQIWNFQED